MATSKASDPLVLLKIGLRRFFILLSLQAAMLTTSMFHKLMALPQRGKWLHFHTALWLITVRAGLSLLPFDWLRGWVVRSDKPSSEPVNIEEMHEITEAIERLGRFMASLQVNCLPQALVGHRLLRRKGFDVQLKIGVLKNCGDQLAAHAWLEYQGRVILGDLRGLKQFTAFPSLEIAQQ